MANCPVNPVRRRGSAGGDFTGNGLSDWLCTASSGTVSVNRTDFSYPDLVVGITNGFGGEIDIVYAPLTDSAVYTRGTGDPRMLNRMVNEGYPLQDVQNAMYVVSDYQLTDSDPSYDYQHSYTYADARIDLDGRGWMGFATITHTDHQLQSQTSTTYLQEFPWNGQASSVELTGCNAGTNLGCGPDGQDLCDQVEYHLTHTAYLCEGQEEGCAEDDIFEPYPGVYQVLPSWVRNDTYSYGTYLFSLGQEYDFDTYGNQILMSDLNYVTEDWSGGSDGDLYTTDDVYAAADYFNQTDGDWLLGFQQSRTECSALSAETCDPNDTSTVLKRWRTNYDYPESNDAQNNGCLPKDDWTFAGTMDVLCRQRFQDHAGTAKEDIGSCAADGIWLATTYTRDAYGHAVEITDSAGNTTTVEYETTYETFPAKTTSPPDEQGLALVTQESYSPWFGKKLTEIDPNGNLFAWCYDAFGRPTAKQGPNTSNTEVAGGRLPRGVVRCLSWRLGEPRNLRLDHRGRRNRPPHRPAQHLGGWRLAHHP